MKIQHKAAAVMTVFGAGIIMLLLLGYHLYAHNNLLLQETNRLKAASEEVALRIDSNIRAKIAIATTIASSPLIKQTLTDSNKEYQSLPEAARIQKINQLNKQWINANQDTPPLVQELLNTPLSKYFKQQQINFPGEYGEIFISNRYGVMLAASGKTTTLAHRDKYWWDNAEKKVFLDDRGYDTSVQGYVMGIVIPIFEQGEMLGILKLNVNIIESLNQIVESSSQHHNGKIKIARSGGLVVTEKGVTPLSTQVNQKIVSQLSKNQTGEITYFEASEERLVTYTAVPITLPNDKVVFGGQPESLGHIKGNQNESWHIVIEQSVDEALSSSQKFTLLIFSVGFIFTALSTFIALMLGKVAANPIVGLAKTARSIGEGDLSARANIHSNDEIGSLAKSLNYMADNLQNSLNSRANLITEVEEHIRQEEKLQQLSNTDELTGIYNRRAFNEKLQSNVSRASRYNEPLSLLLMDIDHFKNINDTYGHDVGDLILKDLVKVILKSIRLNDIFARWGGEEFILLLPQTRTKTALLLAERLRVKIAQHDFPKTLKMTISIGLTSLRADDNEDQLIKRSDIALYQAKNSGRNNVKTE